jgi:hypothetical protein
MCNEVGIYMLFMSMGWETFSELRPPTDVLFVPHAIYEYGESLGGMILTVKNRRSQRKTCPSATLFTINPTRTDPGLRGKWLATNRLSHGTAIQYVTSTLCIVAKHVILNTRKNFIWHLQACLWSVSVPISLSKLQWFINYCFQTWAKHWFRAATVLHHSKGSQPFPHRGSNLHLLIHSRAASLILRSSVLKC